MIETRDGSQNPLLKAGAALNTLHELNKDHGQLGEDNAGLLAEGLQALADLPEEELRRLLG